MDEGRNTEDSSVQLTQHCRHPSSEPTQLMVDYLQPDYSIKPQSRIQVRISSMPQLAEVCVIVSIQLQPVQRFSLAHRG